MQIFYNTGFIPKIFKLFSKLQKIHLYIWCFCGKIESNGNLIFYYKEDITLAKDNSDNIKDSENNNSLESQENSVDKKTEVLPRKRKIVKNVRLPIILSVFLAAFITAVVWGLFFNQSIIGKWYYIQNGEYTETFDSPEESADEPESVTQKYTQRVCYEFTEDGECIVTLGTMSVSGDYNLYSTEGNNMFTASVAYQYTPLLYGSYNYNIKGNAFTKKTLVIYSSDSDDELVLEEGEGENPLEKYDDFKGDDKIVGTWRDDDQGVEYKFTNDGYFTRSGDDGFVIEHVYTVFEDGVLMTKYYGDAEQNYSYTYSFDADNNLILNGTTLKKIN